MSVEPEGVIELIEPGLQTRTRSSLEDANNEWLCAWCLNRVADEKDRLPIEGQSEFLFQNPEGLRFHIFTFARTLGCRPAGTPTLEHTWFQDHAWSYCLCDRCQIHLGWFYTGPSAFAGLIRDRLVRAGLVLN
ncbi:MAG: cereblon family protein [Verrucomicrobiota bacterium]